MIVGRPLAVTGEECFDERRRAPGSSSAWGALIRSPLQIDRIRYAPEFLHPTGSTVRVRQRALQKRRIWALFLRVARPRPAAASVRPWTDSESREYVINLVNDLRWRRAGPKLND